MNSSGHESNRAERPASGSSTLRSVIFRAAIFFGFWLVLTEAASADLAAGSAAAVAATWLSLRLMPAEDRNLHPIKLVKFVFHFLHQSIVAGTDVAFRALDPQLPLQQGFVVYRTRLPQGSKRNGFCAIMSLLPGTLPCGPAEGDDLTIHCLDVAQPVVEQLAAEETLYMQATEEAQHDG
ncbi:MAG TPA: Na+/H+ antiporter subunit E [Bradyrhizobium sp.]|nr:Na+/H+ antiporter subunit E [Bradyrhizobium sp.]